jgi:hypothetical protein
MGTDLSSGVVDELEAESELPEDSIELLKENESWFRTRDGMGIGAALIAATLAAVVASTSFGQALIGISLPEAATVPMELYLAGFLGSLAFIWARIVVGEHDLDEDENNDTAEITAHMLRRMVLGLFGSFPLVFGVYVLAGALAITESVGLLGAAFLTGMFVKVIYETFRELVHRVTLSSNAGNGDANGPSRSEVVDESTRTTNDAATASP